MERKDLTPAQTLAEFPDIDFSQTEHDARQAEPARGLCQQCNQHRIVGGADIYLFATDDDNQPGEKAGQVKLHLQCVGRWAKANPSMWLLLVPTPQLELPVDGKESDDAGE
jgi:hypothetical protein